MYSLFQKISSIIMTITSVITMYFNFGYNQKICEGVNGIYFDEIKSVSDTEEFYASVGYDVLMNTYKQTLDKFVGTAQIFICGDTLQVKDYSKFNWTLFDPDLKKKRHDDTFEEYLERAKEIGMSLVK